MTTAERELTTAEPSLPLAPDSPELQVLFDQIGESALDRERDRKHPFDQIDLLRAARLGAARIPVELGGGGYSLRQLFDLVIRLADADPNVAHILRNHFAFVESRLKLWDANGPDRWLDELTKGSIFGLASGELGSAQAGQNLRGATLLPVEGGYRLSGVKYYSTGSLYSDWVIVRGTIEGEGNASVVVPVGREGLVLDDDWYGMGQRLTGSGTTRLNDVFVRDDEVLVEATAETGERSPYQSTFPNLYLTAIIAGILRNVHRDSVALVKRRSRSFYHAPTEKPTDDPILQRAIGVIASNAFAAETVVLSSAEAMDAAYDSIVDGLPNFDLAHEASLRAAKAKILLDDLGPKTATMIFELGGASATEAVYGLDRHWRNIRTLASHNPASYKAYLIGRLSIDGTPLPNAAYF